LAVPNDISPGRPIFLIGYRGAGKSAVAMAVAKQLAWSWVDADALLEERQQKSIQQIFAELGEQHFRDLEAALLAELCMREKQVIATGGGVVLRAENRDRLVQSGLVVWLQADPQTLWQRLRVDPATPGRRPDLTTGGLAEIESLLAVREPFYRECAQFTVDTVERSPEQVAVQVLRMCQGLWSPRS
jgi:shikimate kinase